MGRPKDLLEDRRAGGGGTLQKALLAWYSAHRRALPWREEPTPYRVWVSELMLQQTRVETVLPYFKRWMEAFPDVATLAKADFEEVLRLWEGLGYYARARHLHRAARDIMRKHDGRIPDDATALRQLPGIGRYTAGAILSIAHGQDVPVVDGNVARVYSRVFCIKEGITTAPTRRRLWTLAEALLPSGQAGDFNQALMEMGARICTPRDPQCNACPIQRECCAFARGIQAHLPTRRRRQVPTHDVAVGVIWQGDRVYIQRRPPGGFLGGLWEFPGGKRQDAESLRSCLLRELAEELGFHGTIGAKLLDLHHAYSMYKVNLHVYECRWEGGIPTPEAREWRWATLDELEELPFPAANRQLIQFLSDREASTLEAFPSEEEAGRTPRND